MLAFLKKLGLLVLVVLVLVLWVMLPWQGALALAVLLALWLMSPLRSGAQTRAVAAVGISTLTQRLGSSAVIVVGIAGVAGVLVALLAMAEGYAQTLRQSGSEDTVIVLRGASAAEVASTLSREDIVQIAQTPGIARNAKGEPLASAETVVAANLPLAGAPDEDGSAQVRGIGDAAFEVRPKVKIIEGRRFQPGLRELVVGKGTVGQFVGMQVGQAVRLGSENWTIVGIFASGDAMESELWADANVVNDSYKRGSGRNSVTARLTSADGFNAFKSALEANPQLKVDVSTTLDFFAKQSEQMTKILRIIGIVVGSIMAVGAVFGALNTMFAAVATRAREIATLRAIGFRGLPVVVAVMLETMLLAALGGIAGGLIAYLLFNGFSASTMAANSVGKLSFHLVVSGPLLWEGLKWALAIGFVGGLFPAVRAASQPVTAALREL